MRDTQPAPQLVPVSRARSRSGPEVVAGSRTMQISKVTDAISKLVHITHECMDYKKLIVWSDTESGA